LLNAYQEDEEGGATGVRGALQRQDNVYRKKKSNKKIEPSSKSPNSGNTGSSSAVGAIKNNSPIS
jgi:hypothetical protein